MLLLLTQLRQTIRTINIVFGEVLEVYVLPLIATRCLSLVNLNSGFVEY